MPLKKTRRTKAGNWYLRGSVAGVSIYESTGTSDAARAEAIRIRRESEILDRSAYGKAATLTFAEAALDYMRAGGESRYLAKILQHFGPDKLLAEIDNPALNDAAEAIYPTAAPATINRQLIVPVSAVVNLAAESGLTHYRKFRRRKGDRIRTRWLTPEEAEALLTAAAELQPHILPAIAFMLGAGCRAGEALSVTVARFYPATGEAHLPDTKNGHARMIRMPERARDLALARPLPETGAICRTPKGKAYKLNTGSGGQLAAAFAEAVIAAGLDRHDVTPHTLRHTWATWYYAQTKDFGGLLDLGGWQKSDMAQRYRKIAPADLGRRLLAHGWDFRTLGERIRPPSQDGTAAAPAPVLQVIK
ncbi:tyrosine-type recombinase/integrase [Salipiger sp.]|uniref:tyrosine-type recombinase/integrase n=1 Tax=Salipiger sp. TaxID=2078585 RepID=UPI003A983BBD